jgi:hypothetical protein
MDHDLVKQASFDALLSDFCAEDAEASAAGQVLRLRSSRVKVSSR